MEKKIQVLRQHLLAWGKMNVRSYPWRRSRDPYEILIAEFMLHRTQAVQVEDVYRRFIQRWPTIEAAVEANRDELLEVLQPLGLHWRNALMLEALSFLWEKYKSVPTDVTILRSVPGIGPYIANATYCFTTNQPVAVVDTNTVRVTGRVFGLDISGEARRRKSVINAIGAACDPLLPRDYYFSMIDLAHIICRPKNPECKVCPLLTAPCEYGRKQTID